MLYLQHLALCGARCWSIRIVIDYIMIGIVEVTVLQYLVEVN